MDAETVSRNIEAVEERIRAACARAGRDRGEVKRVVVSKTFDAAHVRLAAEAGATDFGESRVQEAAEKIPECPGRLTWHFIGHLQTNKVRAAVALFSRIHAIDSLKLLDAVERASADAGLVMPVLLEVNVSGESSKYGLKPGEVPAVIERGVACMHLRIDGLMTIPPFSAEPEDARPCFRRLREFRDRWQADTGVDLPELSMGMSTDLEVAIEEGATWVRVGTAIFGGRDAR